MVVEQEGYGVRKNFAQHSTGKVPQVARPHPLYAVALGELTENGVYPIANSAEEGASFGIGVSFLRGVRSQKLHTHARQLIPGLRRVVVAVSDDQPRAKLGDLWEHGEFVDVGRGHRQAGDETRPANPNVHPETVEGLPEKGILAESCLPTKALAPVGSGEQARRQRHRVADSEGRVVGARARNSCQRSSFILQRLAP